MIQDSGCDGWWKSMDVKAMKTLEQLWNHLPGSVANANASVADSLGSMYCVCGPLKPALLSQAMGLYCAEWCQGVFHRHLIIFESHSHLAGIHGKTLRDKLKYINNLPWGYSGNLGGVLDLIQNTVVKVSAKQEEMPQILYTFSDMGFHCCMRNAVRTV
jgi:hypothetical protein